ncbi:hypothetical protein B296_00029990 [Ensete ventricosum]|uniref:Starch synthase catalytic domain-containing protein n=1 Tax=Ensete ventricosum TaxID=4639 RepID=A0A426ZR12_ENSVE|nr:hypothetical protein B296_00029990 [Ensete ventricosum]
MNAVYRGLSVGLVPINQMKGNPPGAIRRSSSAEGQEDSDKDDEDITDDTLRATIKQSKKVLEMQKNLLRQIVERRKLISSIKDDVATKEDETVSYNQNESSFSNVDIDNDEDFDRTNNPRCHSDSYAQTTEADVLDYGEETTDRTEVEQSVAETLGLLREADLEQSQPQDMLPVTFEESEYYTMNGEILEVSAEGGMQGSNEQQEVPPEEGILDSAPLAGPNVMNVIVVAAECAPWSKTDDFSYVDLPGHYMDFFKLYDPVGGEHCNIFAAGLKAADRLVTVSHGYAWELKTPEGGWGLHRIINDNGWKFQGIVNGIDTRSWNPKFDVYLQSDGYTNYSLETLQMGKSQCKAALQRELGLPVRDNVPIISFIGRLDDQKGVDLIADAMSWLVGQDLQLVMLGTGRPDLEDMLRKFESEHRDKIRGWVGFSVKMAHRFTAGADVLLMPSRFEPCGLNQLYAMMYGTVPVVHAVGGLRDTVKQFDPFNETGLGWTFKRAKANKMIEALGHCLNTYRNYKKSWEGLQRRGMMQDLSWDNAAQSYEDVLVAAKYQW